MTGRSTVRGRQLLPLLLSLPVLVGVIFSLFAALDLAGLAVETASPFDRVRRVLAESALWRGLGWTLWVAAATTAISTALAVLIAVAFRGPGLLDRIGRSIALIPLPVPHIVAAVCGLLILGQSGLLSRLAFAAGWVSGPAAMPELTYDAWGAGLIISLTWKEVPFLTLVASSILAGRSARLEEAARSLGATRWQVIRFITLPLLMRGLLPPVVAVFVFVAGTYETMAILAPSDPLALPLLTMERYTDASLSTRNDAFVLVLVALVIATLAVALHEAVRSRIRL